MYDVCTCAPVIRTSTELMLLEHAYPQKKRVQSSARTDD
uniref:Uncharacterized protein n=1 Tax=Arundo donax TaxID=35708 RepID=A0A0A9BZV1_ARUDO